MGLVQKAFSDIVTFSRSSNATRIGPTGLIQYAPHNLLLYSQELDNAAWTKGANVTVTANAAAAPDGTVTADLVVSSASADSSTNQVFQQVTVASSQTYTASFWVRAAGANQNITVRQTANGVLVTNTTVAVTSTWQRVSVTFTASTNPGFAIRPDTVSNLNIYVWGAQLAVGPLALDYTPTTSAAVYGPRFDYDPVTLAARGLLIEEQRTNLLTYNEMFADASWVKTSATVTANAIAAPDGTVTGDLIESTGAGGRAVQTVSAPSTSVYTYSVYLKKKDTTTVELLCRNNTAGINYAARFNLDTLATSNVSAGATASVVDVGNGWRRCTITTASITSGNSILCYVYGGVGTSGENVYAWGAQLEAGAFATSYIPTLASTVTRSADVASVNTLSPWYNSVEATLFAETSRFTTSGLGRSLQFDDGTSSERIYIHTGGNGGLVVVDGGVDQVSITNGSVTANQIAKVVGAYKLNDFAVSTNGAAVSTDTSGTIPTVTTARIGRNESGSVTFNGHIRRIAYFPRRLSDAELVALTA